MQTHDNSSIVTTDLLRNRNRLKICRDIKVSAILFLYLVLKPERTHGLVNNNFQRVQDPSVLPLQAVGAFGKGASQDGMQPETDMICDVEVLSDIKDLIDPDSGMREFFLENEEWQPLFRSIASHSLFPAMSFMDGDSSDGFVFHENTSPWRRLNAIPTQETDKTVLAMFLDAMQKSLIDIPVDETTKEDANDIHFIEEGRRMLVCSRFHVVKGNEKGNIACFDNLFATCWSEITELRQANNDDTGSLIVVPGLDFDDLRRFADLNLQRPLEWLGIHDDFEIASLEHGGLGVLRLIHKLSDIAPDLQEQPVE